MNTRDTDFDFSIITPIYNDGHYLHRLYNNLCEQFGVKFEWILIDDGSSDDSYEIAKSIIDKHKSTSFSITLECQANKGASEARRTGINLALSEKIFILDADDLVSSDALSFGIKRFSEDIDVVCLNVFFCEEDGTVKSEFDFKPKVWPISGKEALLYCLDGWGIAAFYFVRKSLILSAYDEYDRYLKKHGNTVNGDEFVSRVYLAKARSVTICEGVYKYFENSQSTTRKVNDNYYKTLYTALELRNYFVGNYSGNIRSKVEYGLLLSIFDVYSRYLSWSEFLDNKNDWSKLLLKILYEINYVRVLIYLISKGKFKKLVKSIKVLYKIWLMKDVK